MSGKESVLWNTKAGNKRISSVLREDLGRETALKVSYDSDLDFLYVGFRVPSVAKTYNQFIRIFYSTNDTACVAGIQVWDYQERVEADPNNEELFDEELPFSGILNSLDIQEEVRKGKSFTYLYSLYEVLRLIGEIH